MATDGRTDKRPCSIFDLPPDFFSYSHLIPAGAFAGTDKSSLLDSVVSLAISKPGSKISEDEEEATTIDEGFEDVGSTGMLAMPTRLSCNTCKAEFDSLQDQRSHFKSDFHRLNVKLSLAGKSTMKEEDFDEFTSFPRDFDVSSISGSDDENERISHPKNSGNEGSVQSLKQKLFFSLQSGEKVSLWKSFILKDCETILYDNDHTSFLDEKVQGSYLREDNVIQKLHQIVREPKENLHRIVLLARGGHFAGCVFDGSKVVAHKTFHRYVVRAKAGKKQSSKDGSSGRSIHSAGANLRRYNELALKKDIQELLASWKSYFDASYCVFIHDPPNNRKLFFGDEKTFPDNYQCDLRSIPLTVRRPTFKEAQRIYSQLSQVAYVVEERGNPDEENLPSETANIVDDNLEYKESINIVTTSSSAEPASRNKAAEDQTVSSESETEIICKSTPLHEAAQSGCVDRVLALLEEGLDPATKDERGRTPYMLAADKEVRNTFRRFMAANLEKWDWTAAKVPSALTKEMEDSQAAKQAEKDAKRKAKAKEAKKSRKAREKQAQAEAAAAAQRKIETAALLPVRIQLSKEEELRRKLAEEREQRAAAAERRIAAASSTSQSSTNAAAATSPNAPRAADDMACCCCKASLLGKVPFHRYNYKYCSSTCMHVHKEFLED